MKLFILGDDQVNLSRAAIDEIFKGSYFELLPKISALYLLSPGEIECAALKWAMRLNIPYHGFHNALEAVEASDVCLYIGRKGSPIPEAFKAVEQARKMFVVIEFEEKPKAAA